MLAMGVDFSTKALHCCFENDGHPQIARLEIANAEIEVTISLVFDLLGGLIKTLGDPGILVVERPWSGTNARSVVKLGQVQGAILATAYAHGWIAREVDPSSIRKAIVGQGTAKGKGAIKQIVQDWVKMVYKMELSEDAADAVVIWEYARLLVRTSLVS